MYENGCDETTVSGTVIIEPVDSLTLSSTIASTNQDICVGSTITPIIYEFGAGANGANVTGLPAGVDDTFTERRQVSSILITGPNVATGESYTVHIDNAANTVTSTAGEGPADIAQKLLKIVELKAVINKAKFVELKVCEKISDFLKENFVNDLTYFEKKIK